MYGILKGTGVNAFLMGTPGSEAILLLMLKAAWKSGGWTLVLGHEHRWNPEV
jgi:hypothetical protein